MILAGVAGVLALIRKQGKVQTLASAGGGRLNSTDTEQLDKVWAAMAKKDWAAATKALTELRKTQPDNPLVWYALGHLHTQLGNYEIAIEQYKQAIAVDPNDAEAYCFMGVAYGEMKRYPEAIEAYKKAIAIDPDNVEAYRQMGSVYGALQRYPEAIEAFKKAIAIKPNDARAYLYMGIAYEQLKRYAEAIAACEQYLRLEPTGELADPVREDLPRLRRLAGK